MEWRKDSDTIFTVVSNGAENMAEANRMVMLYVMDLSFSRAGISDALKRLEKHFSPQSPGVGHVDSLQG